LFKGNNLDAFIESSSYASEKGFNLIGIDMKTPGLKDHLKSLKKHGQRRFGDILCFIKEGGQDCY
jgi:hypothetical protein